MKNPPDDMLLFDIVDVKLDKMSNEELEKMKQTGNDVMDLLFERLSISEIAVCLVTLLIAYEETLKGIGTKDPDKYKNIINFREKMLQKEKFKKF